MDVRALAQGTVNVAELRESSAHLNAWAPQEPVAIEPGEGVLSGTTLAVKDIMAIRGMKNGWGSPERLAEAEPAASTQPVVQTLIDAGARFVGLAQCEELCWSLTGSNAHYGAPVNPAAPDRYVGGSSSGSASLAASGTVDIATGSDTGGSVRGPASFAGLVGLRATHDRIPLEGVMPLAHTFDVFGWFARDAALYERVGKVVLGEEAPRRLTRLIRLEVLDGLVLGDEEAAALREGRERIAPYFETHHASASFHGAIDDWYRAFRQCQAFEAWMNLGGFVERVRPKLGPGVKERFEFAARVTKDDYDARTAERHGMIAWAEDMLGDDGCLVLPTVPSCARLKSEPDEAVHDFRERALRLLCLSGLTGLPQITLPLAKVHGAPFGVSLIGPRGSDLALIGKARAILEG